MKIKLLCGMVLGPGQFGVKDDVVTVPDHLAHAWIHERRAVAHPGELVDELPKPPTIVNRDPEPGNRDPKPTKGGRR